jgi:S1-C subfamily serine protease
LNILILTLLSLISFQAFGFGINPTKAQYLPFRLNKTFIDQGEKFVDVKGIDFDIKQKRIIGFNAQYKVDLQTHTKAKKNQAPVYEVISGEYGSGTGFHIGDNFIFTNQHVLSPSRKNLTECKRFSLIRKDDPYKLLMCKKVHYCHKELDFCLIELSKSTEDGFSLKGTAKVNLSSKVEFGDDIKTMAIGNTKGRGLHVSTGFGFTHSEMFGEVYTRASFYAPVFSGNSGGPIFNVEGDVIAIVTSSTTQTYSEYSRNYATPVRYMLDILKEQSIELDL